MRLNLQTSVVEDYYKNKSKRFSGIISRMETVESWVLDSDKNVVTEIRKLTEVLNEVEEYKIMEKSEQLLTILAYLSCGKAYYFMSWLDTNFKKDLSVDFLNKASERYEDNPECSIYIERIDTINKINVIGNVFSDDRLKKIIKILDTIKPNIEEQEEYEFYD